LILSPETLATQGSTPRIILGSTTGQIKHFAYGAVGRLPLFLGHIEVQAGGRYRISRKSSGDYDDEGTYSFDAATSSVKWLSGPCQDDNWSGTFAIDPEDKTNNIRLKRTTIATNRVA
jgi:hypothetical protein